MYLAFAIGIREQGFEAAREYRKAAANVSRVFAELVSALDRKRGQQKVTVAHVHVRAGGNATVHVGRKALITVLSVSIRPAPIRSRQYGTAANTACRQTATEVGLPGRLMIRQ